jgi:predicted nucleic acid-binding protein
MIYALDTNIVSYYLKGNIDLIKKINNAVLYDTIIIPPMVYYEIKKWLLRVNSKNKLEFFEKLISKHGIDTVGKESFDLSASIYVKLQQVGITIEDSDLLIAAYCLQNGYVLITNNTKHFENIENLSYQNWIS